MEKIQITIDPTKVTKEKITTREYEDKLGTMVKKTELKMVVVPLKESKVIWENDERKLIKKYFVAEEQTKEERESGAETNFLGEGLVWEDKGKSGIDAFDDDEVSSSAPF